MDINDKTIVSKMQMTKLYFQELHFKRLNTLNTPGKKEVGVTFNVEKEVMDQKFTITLNSNIMVKENFELKLSMTGEFTVDSTNDAKIFIPNAIAIMFPYLRSQVSLLTAQPSLQPLVLPPFNINGVLREMEKNQQSK